MKMISYFPCFVEICRKLQNIDEKCRKNMLYKLKSSHYNERESKRIFLRKSTLEKNGCYNYKYKT